MVVRSLWPSDAVAHHELRLLGLQESPEAFGATYEEEADLSHERILSRCAEPGETFVTGAFDDADSLIGIVTFIRSNRVKTRHKGSIAGMYVTPQERGKGVGRAMLSQVIRVAEGQPGLEQIGLSVVTANAAARNLYLSHGFVAFGLERKSLKLNGLYYDEEYLVLNLV